MFNMKRKPLSQVNECQADECSFYKKGKCRAIGINVGGPEPLCDTFIHTDIMGGKLNAATKVGACKVQSCVHNRLLQCTAQGIRIIFENNRALCDTYQL